MFPGPGFEADSRPRTGALSKGAQFAAEHQQAAINASLARAQQQQQQHAVPLLGIPSHPQQGAAGVGGLVGGAGTGESLRNMADLGGQLGRSAHGQAMNWTAGSLRPAPGSGHSGLDRSMQALGDDGMADAHGVRRGAASAAAIGAAASAAHTAMAAGAVVSPPQVSGLGAQDGLASQLLARMARRLGGGDGDLGHLLRYMQPGSGRSTNGDGGAGDGHADADDEHQLRQHKPRQQQQQPRGWPPAAAHLQGQAPGMMSAAHAHDPLVSLRSYQRLDTEADVELDKGMPRTMSHAWGQQQRQLYPMEADYRRGPASVTGFPSSTENLALGAHDRRHAVDLLDRVSAPIGRDAAVASRQDELHAQPAAQARPSSLSGMQSWPRKRASGGGLSLELGLHSTHHADSEVAIALGGAPAQAGASLPRGQQPPAEATSDRDSDVEEVPPPQHAARVAAGHGHASTRLPEPGFDAGAEAAVFDAMYALLLKRKMAGRPNAADQAAPNTTALFGRVHQPQQQQQQQQHMLQQHADADGDQAVPDRRRGGLDRSPPRKVQAVQRLVPATAQPDNAAQQRPQAAASGRWPGQPAKQPVITPGRGLVVTARPDQPRVVTTKLPPQTRVLPGSGRTPPPVIRPGPGLSGPSGGPVRGSTPAALAAAATSAAHALPHQPHQPHQSQAAVTAAARTPANVLPAEAVVLRDVDVLLTAIGGLLTRAPAYGVVSITALLGLHAKLCVRRGVALSPWVLWQSRSLAATQAAARSRGSSASTLAACDTKLLLLLDMGPGGLGSESNRPPRLQHNGNSRRGASVRSGGVLDTSQLGSWFVVHWWPDKEGDEVSQGVGGTSGSGSCGRPQLESLHAFAARFLPQGVAGRAAAEDTAEAEQAVLELISVLPCPESSGVKGLEELRGALTSGNVQEHELLPLAQWWQGGPGPCSALGAAHGAAAEHQRQYHEQHMQTLGGSDAQQDPASSSAFAALLLLAEAAMEPQPAKEAGQEQSVLAPAASVRQEVVEHNPSQRAQGAAPGAGDGGGDGGVCDLAMAQQQVARPPSQTASPKLS